MLERFCIFLIVILLNFQVISFKYTVDDKIVLTLNKITQQGISGIPELILQPRLEGYFGSNDGTYRPVPMITHALEYEVFGFNPATSHFINLILYAILCVLVFEILKNFTSNKVILWGTLFIFTFHPIHLEVISAIKARDDLVGGIFGCLFILNFFRNKKSITNIFFLIIAFLCKESLLLLAFLPLVYNKDWKLSAKYCASLSVFVLWHEYIVRSAGNIQIIGSYIDNPLLGQNISTRIYSILDIINSYFQNMFLMTNYRTDYSYPVSLPVDSFSLTLLLGIIVVGIGFLTKFKTHIIMSLILLLPSLNILMLIGAYYGDRLAFHASIFFILFLGSILQSQNKKISFALITLIILINSKTYFSNISCWESQDSLAKCSEKNNIKSWKDLSNIGIVAMLRKDYNKCVVNLSLAQSIQSNPINNQYLESCKKNL